MEWFEKLGFLENPFEINLFTTDKEVIGLEKEKTDLLYRVSAGSMVLVEGAPGSGKTALLKHIIDHFRGRGKVIYVNALKLNKALDIEELLINRYGVMGKLFGKKPKNMILLLDNCDSLSRRNAEKIKFYFDEDYLHSVVFATDDAKKVLFDDSIKDRLEKRIIKLHLPTQESMVNMIRDRLNENIIFSEETIKILVQLSGNNPKKVLANASKLGEYLAKNDKPELNKTKIKSLIRGKEKTLKDSEVELSFLCLQCGAKLKKIGENWRCKHCDRYCSGCGALVEDEDSECPSCGGVFKK